MTFTLILLGLMIGMVMAVTGAGGGIIGVPMLILVTGLSVQQAIPVALMAVFVAALLGTYIGWRRNHVRYRAALLIALTGVIFSPLGLWLGHQLDHQWLNLAFALLLFVLAIRALTRKGAIQEVIGHEEQSAPCIRDDGTGRFQWTSRCAQLLAASGGVAGFMSGLLGAGGGFVIVPALQKYTDLNMSSVVATSLAVTAIISFTVVATSAMAGKFDTLIAWPFVAGALLGIAIGHRVAKRLDQQQIQKIFSYLLIVIAFLLSSKSVMH
jgi:uncharacterized membrane protein YfcA